MTEPGRPLSREELVSSGWRQSDLVPRPDPTFLTNRALAQLTDEYRREISQLRELIEVRLGGMDKAMVAHLADMGQLRNQIEAKITHLADLTAERFASIDRRFEDRDARGVTHQINGEKALAAALESARQLTELQNRANKELAEQQDRANSEAITKAQASTSEKLRSLEQVAATDRQGLRELLDDTRTRLTTIESLTRGIEQVTESSRESRGLRNSNTVVALMSISMLISLAAIIITVALHKLW